MSWKIPRQVRQLLQLRWWLDLVPAKVRCWIGLHNSYGIADLPGPGLAVHCKCRNCDREFVSTLNIVTYDFEFEPWKKVAEKYHKLGYEEANRLAELTEFRDELKIDLAGLNEPTQESLMTAAGIWCEPVHSHKVFDPELAVSIARVLDHSANLELKQELQDILEHGD